MVRELRVRLEKLTAASSRRAALEVLAQLETLDPDEPRWPHKRGDVLLTLGQPAQAAEAYHAAADRYAAQGFPPRAAAIRQHAERLSSPTLPDPAQQSPQATPSQTDPRLRRRQP
jgi:hypothetical protein